MHETVAGARDEADSQHQLESAKGRERGAMRRALVVAAVGEIATGAALLIVPSVVGLSLFGEELTGVAVTLARVTGIALVALGVACWPGTPLVGMLTYSTAAGLYLAYVAFAGPSSGMLLWPAVILHLVLAALLTRASTTDRTPRLGQVEGGPTAP